MGFLDKLKRHAGPVADKAVAAVADNAHKVDGGIDKVAETVDRKTGGKHRDKIHKAKGQAKGLVDKAEEQSARRSRRGPTPPTVDPDAGR